MGSRCFTSLAAAVAYADDGDVVTLGRGTFQGGVTITESIRLVGAGQGATVIRGGHPVLTIATADPHTPPQVSIARLTVTGGVNWYWSGHAAKFTFDVQYFIDEQPVLVNTRPNIGFIGDDDEGEVTLRFQFQFLF